MFLLCTFIKVEICQICAPYVKLEFYLKFLILVNVLLHLMCRYSLCFVKYQSSQILFALLSNLAEIILGPGVNYIPPKLAFPFSMDT